MTKRLKATFTLRPDIKEKWLAALRNGTRKQGQSALYNAQTKGYCCLGVLCSVMRVPRLELDDVCMPNDLENFHEIFRIPLEVEADEMFWKVPYKGKLRPLEELNDIDKLSFKQIANIIERTVGTH